MTTEAKTPTESKTTAKAKADSEITSDSGVAINDIPFPISVTESTVNIIAPPNNTFVSPRDTLVGTASAFERTTDSESGQVIEEHDATNEITSVTVQAAAIGTVNAVATGPADRPWATWSFALSSLPAGPVAIHARVSPNTFIGSGADRQLTVDAAPPSFTVNPPADVLRPAPPYIATLTGTAADDASGVAAVEWQLGGNGFRVATGTTNWSAEVVFPELGTFTVAVQARDNVGNVSAAQSVTVRVGDNTPPALDISVPTEGQTFSLVDGKVDVPLRGTAFDTQTGVALVEWSLDGQTFTAATPNAANDWSTWSAQIPFSAAGSRTITVRATDKETNPHANVAPLHRGIEIAEPFQPKDPDAVFSPTAYLDDLLEFATHRARAATAGALITRQLLVDTYLQPFADLVTPDNRVVANQPASQVRLCIEVLRRYMALHERSVPANAEAAYRLAAYVALLRQLGISYDEMRLARVADDAARVALASRLGIGLSQSRRDRLDELLFQPSDLTEVALKTFFGLEETTLKPLAASLLPVPNLLIWQKEHLRAAWQQQDDAARTEFDTPVPLIDPDLISPQDLRTPSPGNSAYDLWKARQDDLAAQLAALDAARKAQSTQQAGFDQIVSDAVGPVAELLALDEERQRGNAIDVALKAKRLSMQAFLHLMRLRQLAVVGTVLDAEWADVYAILTQVKKLGSYAAWRSEEQLKGLILGPDFFQVPDAALAQTVLLPAWRATPQARQAWRRTLESRVQQELTLTQALQAVVSAAEQEALPMLRDACVAAIAGDRDAAVIADSLTQELGIDCKDSGHLKTTRAQQALQTLQEVLLSLRTGRLKTTPPVLGTTNPAAAWELVTDPLTYTEADFDEEWQWMGGYATWNSAIRVFAYPESYLLPELRPPSTQTKAYADLMAALRNQPRLTPQQARDLAAAYLAALKVEPSDPPRSPPVPDLPADELITDQLTDTQLAARRDTLIPPLFGDITDPSKVPNHIQEIFYFVPMALALQLQKSGEFLVALDWIETVYTDHFETGKRKIYRGLFLEETIATQYVRNPDNWLRVGLNPHEIGAFRASAHTRFTLMTLARCYLDFADAEFTRDDGESVARARALYGTALALIALPEMQPPTTGAGATPFPPNPVPLALKMRGELNLFKLRSGRNIAGIERQATALIQPVLTLDRLPVAGGSQRTFRPTPYHYAVLVERAKNLVSIAQQVEQAFLASLEKRDAERYNLLKAGHDLQLAGATVDLHTLQVKEAEQGIGLAERQLDRAATQRDAYQQRIDAGLNSWEIGMLDDYQEAALARDGVIVLDAVLTTAQSVLAASTGGILGTGVGAGLGGVGLVGLLSGLKAEASIFANHVETSAQINSAKASFERRKEEWELQRQLSESDMAVGAQQIVLAQTHSGISRQEEFISRIQLDQSQATVEFLANKFTSAELYAWMSGILGGAYNYFLQQATAMAQLAQYQLAFERQESPPAFIKADYWEDTNDATQPAAGQNAQPDRQGLTGSVRLLQDITRLDQFAFDTNRRKLQLSETFSLARLFPVEFQNFRQTGSLPFATPMTLFDRGFPGHYLRLIKRVRVSVIALVPPVQGLRATLIASGISRVVSGGDVFQSIVVRRDPELIAFTSTSNATGLLELEPDVGMLLPFESMGVDTNWELQLPKAANPFDFRSISDVLLTVEYTALQNFSYRQQVIQQLDDNVSAERVFSVRDQFADQWYALHNPERAVAPMTVKFTLTPQGFPPNVEDVRIQQVFFAVARADGQSFEIGNTQLLLTPEGETVAVGGAVDGSTDGLISTRRGNASAWIPLIGKSPAGAWELSLPNTEEMKNRFKNEDIDDLLLVITYEGRTPAWPV
jgi:hypothetical protein